MKQFESFKISLHRNIYGDRKITELYFYVICLVLRISGSNIYHDNWRPNLMTIYHIIANIFFLSLIIFNMCKKALSSEVFQFPEDMNYLTMWAAFTVPAYGTYVVLINREALRDVYDWVFVEFHAWFSSDKLKMVKYEKKASRLWAWAKFSVAQMMLAVLLVLFRPMFDSSTLPFYDETCQIPGLHNYTTFGHHAFYAAQVLAATNMTVFVFCSDAIFVTTLAHISADLFMLGEDLEEAGHSGDDVILGQALKTFAARHYAVKKCLQRLSGAYKPQSIVIPFMALAFSTVSLLTFDGTLASIPALGMGITQMLHLLNFCLPSQLVVEESEALFVRLMHSNWQSWPLHHQKTLLLLMPHLLTPLRVQCGISGAFSLQMYGTFLQKVYSLYNTARQYQ